MCHMAYDYSEGIYYTVGICMHSHSNRVLADSSLSCVLCVYVCVCVCVCMCARCAPEALEGRRGTNVWPRGRNQCVSSVVQPSAHSVRGGSRSRGG